MCNHVFCYPEDKRENYNPSGMALTGICKHCGDKKDAYGMRWAIEREEIFLWQDPTIQYSSIDTTERIW